MDDTPASTPLLSGDDSDTSKQQGSNSANSENKEPGQLLAPASPVPNDVLGAEFEQHNTKAPFLQLLVALRVRNKEKKSMSLDSAALRAFNDELGHIRKEAMYKEAVSKEWIEKTILGGKENLHRHHAAVSRFAAGAQRARRNIKDPLARYKMVEKYRTAQGAAALKAFPEQTIFKKAMIGSLLGRVGGAAIKGVGRLAKATGTHKAYAGALKRGVGVAGSGKALQQGVGAGIAGAGLLGAGYMAGR